MEIFTLNDILDTCDYEDGEYTEEDLEEALKIIFGSSTYNRETDFFWEGISEMSSLIGTVMEELKEGTANAEG